MNRTGSVSSVEPGAVSQVPVKLDARGRLRTSPEQRRALLEEYERSGQSAAGFARRTGLKYSTLAGWLTRYRRSQPVRPAPSLRLLEAVMESPPAPAAGAVLTLQLPGGIRVEVANEQQAVLAAALVRAWEKPC